MSTHALPVKQGTIPEPVGLPSLISVYAMLNTIALFSSIPAERLAQLEQHFNHRTYPKNTILFMEGDTAGQLYIIESGLVSVYTDSADGKQLILNFLSDGDCFGELSLLDNKPRSASVMTLADSKFAPLPAKYLKPFCGITPIYTTPLICELAGKVRQLTENVKDMALLDVYGRVAHTLERLTGENNRVMIPKLTHQDIANMVGASREMVSRIMKELVLGGYIGLHQRHIEIKKSFPKGLVTHSLPKQLPLGSKPLLWQKRREVFAPLLRSSG